jgi:monoterpene epsilon-lactone hydrolase
VRQSPAAHLIRLGLRAQRPLLRRLHHPGQLGLVERAMTLTARLPQGARRSGAHAAGAPVLTVQNLRADRRPGHTLVYVHGGGFATGSPETHCGFAARLMLAGRFESLLMPRYRLSTEAPWPAAHDDVHAFWEALVQERGGADGVALAGESAGANLCLSLCVRARDEGVALPSRVYLHSPWLDVSLSGASYRDLRIDDGFTGRHPQRREWLHAVFAQHYAGASDPRQPHMSPLFADLHGLPALYVDSGEHELFRDDVSTLRERCAAAGTPCDVHEWAGMWHGFGLLAPLLPEANRAITRAGRFLADGS